MVERDIFDDVVAGVAARAKKIKLGPGMDPATEMGPLVSQEQLAAGHRLSCTRAAGYGAWLSSPAARAWGNAATSWNRPWFGTSRPVQ